MYLVEIYFSGIDGESDALLIRVLEPIFQNVNYYFHGVISTKYGIDNST